MSDNYPLWQRLVKTLLIPEIESKHYEIIEEIGEGGFGKVHKVQGKLDGILRAMKKVKFDATGKDNYNLKREIFNILSIHRHSNIVHLTDIFRTVTHLCISMELCDMDLSKFMEERSNRQFVVCLEIAKQICTGITFLHNHDPPFVHRDIKPQNILIKIDEQTGKKIAKIADFGLSTVSGFSCMSNGESSSDVTSLIDTLRSSDGVHGTLPFMAPEMFAAKGGKGLVNGRFLVHVSADIFASGLVLCYMFCYHDSDYVWSIREGFNDALGEDMYEAEINSTEMPAAVDIEDSDSIELKTVKQLIIDMTIFEPNQRPSSKQVLEQVTYIERKLDTCKSSNIRRHKCRRYMKASVLPVGFFVLFFALITWSSGHYSLVWEKTVNLVLNAAVYSGQCGFVGALVYLGADVEANVTDYGMSLLHQACRHGHLQCVHQLLAHGANIEAKTRVLQETPLHLAVYYNHNDIVKSLIRNYSADAKAARSDGVSALHLAAALGRPDIIKTLLSISNVNVDIKNMRSRAARDKSYKRNDPHMRTFDSHENNCHSTTRIFVNYGAAKVEAKDLTGATPLHLAASFNQIDCLKMLIDDYDANINAVDNDGNKAIHFASCNGNADIIDTLLLYPTSEVNSKGWGGYSPLHMASVCGQIDSIHTLMKHGADVEARTSTDSDTPLTFASWFNQTACVKTLIDEYNAKINSGNKYGHTALQHAARRGYVDVLKTLLSQPNCEVNLKDHEGRTALHHASIHGQLHSINVLMSHRANVESQDDNGFTSLLFAVRFNKIDCINTLVDTYKASLTAINKEGLTVLHLAALNGDLEIIHVLRTHEPRNLRAKDSRGRTPLHYAVEQGLCNFCIIDLASSNEIVNLKDNEGTTALHLAISGGQYEAAVILINRSAKINSRDNSGQTPLHKAALMANMKLMKLLMSYPECDVKARDADGKTAADFARETRLQEFAKYLEDAY